MFYNKRTSFSSLQLLTKDGFHDFVKFALSKDETILRHYSGNGIILFVTNTRLIFMDFTQDHKNYDSFFFLPYNQISLFSANLTTTLTQSSTLRLLLSNSENITLEFTNRKDAENLCNLLSQTNSTF